MESESGNSNLAKSRVLLLVVTPPAPPGAPVNVQRMAVISIVIGVVGAAAGTLTRWYYLE